MVASLQPELGHRNRSLLLRYGIENKCYQQLVCTNIPGLNSKAAFPNSSLNHQETNANVFASGTHGNCFGMLLTLQITWVQKGPLPASAVRIGKASCKIAILSGVIHLKLFLISANLKKHQESIRVLAGGAAQTP